MYETFQVTVWFCISCLSPAAGRWSLSCTFQMWRLGGVLTRARPPGTEHVVSLRLHSRGEQIKILVTEWERVQICHLYTLSYSSVYYLEPLFTYLLGFTDGNTKF